MGSCGDVLSFDSEGEQLCAVILIAVILFLRFFLVANNKMKHDR